MSLEAPSGEFALDIVAPGDGRLVLRLHGDWRSRDQLPPRAEAAARVDATPGLSQVEIDGRGIEAWDSGLLIFVAGLERHCAARGVRLDTSALPEGVRSLLALAAAVPPPSDAGRGGEPEALATRVGEGVLAWLEETRSGIAFLGAAMIALGRFVTGRAQYRRGDLALFVQDCGANAFGIVSLISFLVGVILAFVGAQQLQQFGATIFVADLVAIANAREMAPIMAAIIMAGRTGAAFAAQLGTMTVNEEIDALKTFGVSPMEFLVLPRMLALIVMLPLLCLYANLMGFLGGILVSTTLYDLTAQQYWQQTVGALALRHLVIGVVKSAVFGVLVALAGCHRGIRSGRSAAAVGEAATSAVVTAIVLIIVTDAVFAVALDVLGL